jgi:hypothetical protein
MGSRETAASPVEQRPEWQAWPPRGPRWAYVLAGAAILVALFVLSLVIPSGGTLSSAGTARLIDQSYEVSGTTCQAAPQGRYLCTLKGTKCHGTMLIALTSRNDFTIVSATPENLTSARCGQSEAAAAEHE